ncbi:MAG: hypothetical protein ACRECD_09890 [Burkholderiaceae bacterium]
MPEQLTKHPELTLQVLRSSGAKCAEGAAQDILTQCPAERFCKLPGGEICVFGLPDASRMTQISATELRALVAPVPSETLRPEGALSGELLLSAGIGLLAGAAIAIAVSRLRNHRH